MDDAHGAAVRESNRQTREAWSRYAGHRDRVMELLAQGAGGTLCILGGGNLNDVRIDELQARYAEIHLVDLDVDALQLGLARQRCAPSRLRVHGPVDLTGIHDQLPTGGGSPEVTERLLKTLARRHSAVEGGPFDVTVSAAVLTQLLQSIHDSSLPRDRVDTVCLALRDKHLADLVRLTRPGGVVVLITDVVSTSTAPRLLARDAAELEAEMARLVAARNFFTGVNPYRIVALLEEDERFRDVVQEVRLLDPWLWPVTPDREHLTCAIVARRTERACGQRFGT